MNQFWKIIIVALANILTMEGNAQNGSTTNSISDTMLIEVIVVVADLNTGIAVENVAILVVDSRHRGQVFFSDKDGFIRLSSQDLNYPITCNNTYTLHVLPLPSNTLYDPVGFNTYCIKDSSRIIVSLPIENDNSSLFPQMICSAKSTTVLTEKNVEMLRAYSNLYDHYPNIQFELILYYDSHRSKREGLNFANLIKREFLGLGVPDQSVQILPQISEPYSEPNMGCVQVRTYCI